MFQVEDPAPGQPDSVAPAAALDRMQKVERGGIELDGLWAGAADDILDARQDALGQIDNDAAGRRGGRAGHLERVVAALAVDMDRLGEQIGDRDLDDVVVVGTRRAAVDGIDMDRVGDRRRPEIPVPRAVPPVIEDGKPLHPAGDDRHLPWREALTLRPGEKYMLL